MAVHCIDTGVPFDSNVYLLTGRETILIDTGTGMDADRMLNSIRSFIGSCRIDRIILTHCHYDHSGGAARLMAEYGCPCYAGHLDANALRNAEQDILVSPMFSYVMEPLEVEDLHEGDIIDNGEHMLQVICTPGHTAGSICLYDLENKMLFSGDTIFAPGIGRTDLPGGSFSELAESIRRISKLDIIGLYPGHGSASEEYGSDYVSRALRTVDI